MAGERKKAYIREVIRDMQLLAEMSKRWTNQENEYFDNGYNGAGGDPITDADLTFADISTTNFTNCITLIQNFEKLRTNQTPTIGDYASYLNAVYRASI